ncbi:MAG: twin-arginine translocation signal domain-containing protein, partial [bacterium]
MPKKKVDFSRRDFVKTGALATAAITASNIPRSQKARAESAPKPDSGQPLKDYPITHGVIKPVMHPRLGVEMNGQSAVRYLRFMRPARIDRLELGRIVYGRWIPKVPAHPAHVIVSKLKPGTCDWEIVREVDFPPDRAIQGEGLSQEMSVEEMDAHFDKVLAKPPHSIELGGLTTDHLRVECDREHPYWPNHGECNGGPFNVPFGALNNLRAIGELTGEAQQPVYNPILKVGEFRPQAPDG